MATLGPYAVFSGGGPVVKKSPQQIFAAGQAKRVPVSAATSTGLAPAAPAAGGGGGGQAAPGTPAPWQPFVDAQVQGIYSDRDMSLAQLNESEKFLRLDFGLIAQGDGSFAVDVGNPAGKAALMQRSYQQAKRGDMNSMAARGQLTSGAYQRAVSERNRSEQLDFNTLTKSFSRGLGDIERGRQQATSAAAAAEASARLQGAMSVGGDVENTAPQSAPQATEAAAAAAPKSGFKFVQSVGTRAGLSYNLEKRADGKWVRVYENGDRVLRV